GGARPDIRDRARDRACPRAARIRARPRGLRDRGADGDHLARRARDLHDLDPARARRARGAHKRPRTGYGLSSAERSKRSYALPSHAIASPSSTESTTIAAPTPKPSQTVAHTAHRVDT